MFKRIMSMLCLLSFFLSFMPVVVLADLGKLEDVSFAKALTDQEMQMLKGGSGKGGGGSSSPPPPPKTICRLAQGFAPRFGG